MDNRKMLNIIYEPLTKKAESVFNTVKNEYNNVFYGFYNNHYIKNETGEYIPDYFPIPVISIENLCDIEFDLDTINITSKLTKQNAADLEYSKLNGLKFEIYGVLDYLKDYHTELSVLDDSILKISESKETEFFFTFYFSNNIDINALSDFLNLIKNEKFYY